MRILFSYTLKISANPEKIHHHHKTLKILHFMQKTLSTIGTAEKFYGYITGTGIESCANPSGDEIPSRLYASFEYNGKTTVWCVPDHELFGILAHYLTDMALMRSKYGDYGYSKLWISKKNGAWCVELP